MRAATTTHECEREDERACVKQHACERVRDWTEKASASEAAAERVVESKGRRAEQGHAH